MFDLEEVVLNEKVLQFYLSAVRKIQRRFRLEGKLSVSEMLNLPRIFSVQKQAPAPEKLWVSFKPLLEKALGRLSEARIREGKILAGDIRQRVRGIGQSLSRIEGRIRHFPQVHYEKIRRRIQNLFEGKEIPEERVWQEVALLAEKADVTEEVVRLKSHLALFQEKLAKEEEVGKELDFLSQEVNREINTLGAKAQDFGISKEVISMKAELEKIREQVQNIE